jgi:hypothetical protein
MGGNNAVSNLQTLCKHCNTVKGVNEVNYLVNISPLRTPKPDLQKFEHAKSDSIENAITRIVNCFYHSKALCTLNFSQRSHGKFYLTWEIVLFSGNDPDWLKAYEKEILDYVHMQHDWKHVTKIIVRN